MMCAFCGRHIDGRRYHVQTKYEVGWADSRDCKARVERGELPFDILTVSDPVLEMIKMAKQLGTEMIRMV